MSLRRMILLIVSLFALSTNALAQTITADGHVVYKMPNGELVTRNVTLEVPMRGQGDIVMIAGSHRVTAEAFKVRAESGRTILAIAFVDPPGAPEGTTGVFRGTVIHGTNLVMYYGDIFKKTTTSDQLAEDWDDVSHDATYIGGFHFTKAIGSDQEE